MNTDFVILIVVAVLLLVCGVLILLGSGDWLISGYNTASKQKKEKYNLPHLRLLTGLTCMYTAVIIVVNYFIDSELFITCAILPVVIITILLSNTWAKRK